MDFQNCVEWAWLPDRNRWAEILQRVSLMGTFPKVGVAPSRKALPEWGGFQNGEVSRMGISLGWAELPQRGNATAGKSPWVGGASVMGGAPRAP